MINNPIPVMKSVINSKFRGCLLGGLIGDCIGAPYEGSKVVGAGTLSTYFQKLLKEDDSTRSLQIYSYTDDTAMMKSVAGSLLHCQGFQAKDMAKRFTEEYLKEPRRGYGGTVVDIFREWNDSDYQEVMEPAKYAFDGSGSLGNGSAMRVAPMVLFSHAKRMSADEMISVVKESCQLTHTHPYGYNGAILQALVIKHALELEAKMGDAVNVSRLLDSIIPIMKRVEEQSPDVAKPKNRSAGRIRIDPEANNSKTPYTDKLIEMKRILEDKTQGADLSSEEIVLMFGNSVSAMRSVPSAVYCVLRSIKGEIQDFKTDNPLLRCLFLTISLGGDTDTISTMACSTIGALYGEQVIDPVLRRRCEFNQETTIFADQLSQLMEQ